MKEFNITSVSSLMTNNKTLVVDWIADNIGFGQLLFRFDEQSGKICIDSELMNREFIKSVFNKVIDDSVFTDFEKLIKKEEVIALKELNSLFKFEEHIVILPFYVEKCQNENATQYRWRIEKNKVVNVWINGDPENIFQLSNNIQKNKSFPENINRAELWTWDLEIKE